jgi:hypothetical protein
MYEYLPTLLRSWVTDQAERMGLPDPDSFIMLLIQLEKQNHDLAAIYQRVTALPVALPSQDRSGDLIYYPLDQLNRR